ncbi:MAG: radical SAM protein [Lachnospiraceae bacterium]|nr:radical SAM protein [Lachnospiraceae bacterium]
MANSLIKTNSFFDLSDCILCPRACHADRLSGASGFCGEAGEIRAARAALYYSEEPVISGQTGSGTVFFSGCNVGCSYCQNYKLLGSAGTAAHRTLSPSRLAEVFLSLQEQSAANINLVTAAHFLPRVIPALESAKRQGLSIPVVYNTSSYERVEAIRALEGLVDVWLPDFKYFSPELARRYSKAPDYPEVAAAALAEMVRQCPVPLFSDGTHAIDAPDDADDPLMIKGVIVRHLALPGCAEDSRRILSYLYSTYGDSIFISLLNQYTPAAEAVSDPLIGRRLTEEEYDDLVDYAISLGITNGFIQGAESQSLAYTPTFDGTGLDNPYRGVTINRERKSH